VSEIWTVRGISDDIQKRVSDAARAAGMRLGPFVERILLDALERPEGQGAPVGQGGAGDLAALVAAISATVDAHTEAIHVLFDHHRSQDFPAIVKRLERLEASQVVPAIPGRSSGDSDKGRVPAAIPSFQGSAADAVKPAGGAEMPETAKTHLRPSGGAGRRSPRPWTDVDDAELRRIFDRGGTQAEAVREMSRPNSVISRKWAVLLQEQAERTLPPLEKIRRVTEMQKDGTPETEIAEFLKGEPKEPDGQGS
jgi:hypothetical protein